MSPTLRNACLAWVAAFAALAVPMACRAPTTGGLHVVVEGDLQVGADFDLLVVDVTREGEAELLKQELFEGALLTELPIGLNFVSGPSTPVGTPVQVLARAVKDAQVVAVAQGTGALEPKGGATLTLTLERTSTGGTYVRAHSGENGVTCAKDRDCVSGLCVENVCCDSRCDGPCDACDRLGSVGTCVLAPRGVPGSPSCAPYTCSGDSAACLASCATSDDCVITSYCHPDGTCQPRTPAGVACQEDRQCATGPCVEGLCCNRACNGVCERCDVPGALGTCTPLTEPRDGGPSCAPYRCSLTGACGTSCASGSDCDETAYCAGGTCLPKKSRGSSCASATECVTGFCSDGYCCNTACTGACDTCAPPGTQPGTCAYRPQGTQGVPSCSLYVCSGTSSACPASCSSDAGCAVPYRCVGTSCVP